MNVAIALCIVAAVVGVVVAILGLRFGSAPGWSRYRALTTVGLTAAVYSVLDAFWTANVSSSTLVLAMSLQGVVSAMHVAAWRSYMRQHLDLRQTRVDRMILALLFAIAALWLVPGLLARQVIESSEIAWLGLTYRYPEARVGAAIIFLFETALIVEMFVRYVRAARAGPPDARVHALALGAILLAAINDTLVATDVVRLPMILTLGFLVAVGAIGVALTRSFVASARELDRLSRSLEYLVATRTRALVETEAALLRAEKMAAIGRLSAGVAHEINNPAAAVSANLSYLRDGLASGKLPSDAAECLDESIEGVARIAKIVAQLLDSGRAAVEAREGGTASVLRAVQQALATARPRLDDHVSVTFDVPPDLFVRAEESSLVQVLVNLVVNAAHAIPIDQVGRIEIRTSKSADRVAIDVVDNGTGMSDETKRRLFEPFFTTKPVGRGTGLGLAVSLGLVRSMAGDLRVTPTSKGTCMTISLEAGEAPLPTAAPD